MANSSFLRMAELLRSVVGLLWNKPEGLSSKEIMALLPRITPLTENETEYSYTSNGPRYEIVLRLATIPFAKAGWMVKSNKGRWYLTEDGRQACKQYTNAQDLYQEALRLFDEEQRYIPEAMITVEASEEAAWNQIEKFLQARNIFEIRSMVVNLLRASGYHVTWIRPREDNSSQPDIVAWMDPIGVSQTRILVQVIHKGQAITPEGIKSFSSRLEENDFGLIFSTGSLTNEVKEEIKSVSKNMLFMDLESFYDLWIAKYDEMDREAQRLLPLKSVHFLYF
jgi:hypothetical protein